VTKPTYLDEAGYLTAMGMIRGDATNPLEYRLYAEETGTYARILEIISDNLAAIGISAPPTLMDGDSLYSLLEPDWDFDMILWSWGWDPDPDFAIYVFTCGAIPENLSDSGYCNEAYDKIYTAQGDALDLEQRKQDREAGNPLEDRPTSISIRRRFKPNARPFQFH
jgi:peptide/nickel transport system substrate-binding protein